MKKFIEVRIDNKHTILMDVNSIVCVEKSEETNTYYVILGGYRAQIGLNEENYNKIKKYLK